MDCGVSGHQVYSCRSNNADWTLLVRGKQRHIVRGKHAARAFDIYWWATILDGKAITRLELNGIDWNSPKGTAEGGTSKIPKSCNRNFELKVLPRTTEKMLKRFILKLIQYVSVVIFRVGISAPQYPWVNSLLVYPCMIPVELYSQR